MEWTGSEMDFSFISVYVDFIAITPLIYLIKYTLHFSFIFR